MTNDKKQTAIEWLIEQVEGLNINDDTVWAEVQKEALEMEKQQRIEAHINCVRIGCEREDSEYKFTKEDEDIVRNDFENYYKETYDKNS